jgi:hypothetical protein
MERDQGQGFVIIRLQATEGRNTKDQMSSQKFATLVRAGHSVICDISCWFLYFLLCISKEITNSVHCLVPCFCIVSCWAIAGVHVLLGHVEVAFIDHHPFLLIFFHISNLNDAIIYKTRF